MDCYLKRAKPDLEIKEMKILLFKTSSCSQNPVFSFLRGALHTVLREEKSRDPIYTRFTAFRNFKNMGWRFRKNNSKKEEKGT